MFTSLLEQVAWCVGGIGFAADGICERSLHTGMRCMGLFRRVVAEAGSEPVCLNQKPGSCNSFMCVFSLKWGAPQARNTSPGPSNISAVSASTSNARPDSGTCSRFAFIRASGSV